MASNLFKTRYMPNADGTDTTAALTNANSVFVHTYLGDDNTGDGTREKPYRSMTKANLKAGVSYIVFRGVINEAFSTTKTIIGDDLNQTIVSTNYTISTATIFRCTVSGNIIVPNGYSVYNSVVTGNIDSLGSNSPNSYYCLVKGVVIKRNVLDLNDTHLQYVTSTEPEQPTNGIIIKYLNFIPSLTLFGKNMVIPATCIFKYNSINILQPNFTNDSKANISMLRNAYITAGMPSINALRSFPQDSFGNETYLIIKESRAGGSHTNIFNKYDTTLTGTITAAITANQAKTSIQLTVADSSKFPASGDIFVPNTAGDGYEVFTYTSVTINSATLITLNGASYTFKMAHANSTTCTRYGDVLDFTLNPDPLNEALWASDIGGYVGCFRPAVDGLLTSNPSIIDVNADGTDTANAGNLIQVDASGNLVFNTLSAQLWNRFRDVNCVEILLGSKFKGLNAMSNDGSPFGTYIGKKQNLIDTTIINPGDALTVGAMYKVFNDSVQDVTKAIIYNSVQYIPEYTFMCIAGATTFSLLNAGSGTYVKKVNADVLESIEILPYDNATTPSAFPKFSAPLMGECKLLYYTAAGATRYGKTAGNPVLFGDLAVANMITDFGTVNDKMSYYDGYAVSNADQEFFTLANPSLTSPKSTYFTTAIPTLRFLKREINAHFDLPYDY